MIVEVPKVGMRPAAQCDVYGQFGWDCRAGGINVNSSYHGVPVLDVDDWSWQLMIDGAVIKCLATPCRAWLPRTTVSSDSVCFTVRCTEASRRSCPKSLHLER